MNTPTLYGYDAVNQMTSAGPITYGYDNNGNRTTATNNGLTTTYLYDGVDRLTRINYPQPGTPYSTYEYNGDGLRVKVREKTGLTTRYVWSGSDVINEYTDTWTLLKSYYLGGGLEGQIAGTTYSYYHPDGLGSIMKITGATGTITDSYDFDEFGSQIMTQGTTPNVYKYTGQQSDMDSGLCYLRARYYEPSTGRFITKDPFKGDRKNPMTLNPYLYCLNNPINRTDPSGLSSKGPNSGMKTASRVVMAAGGTAMLLVAIEKMGGLAVLLETKEGCIAIAAVLGARAALAAINHPVGIASTFWYEATKTGDLKAAEAAMYDQYPLKRSMESLTSNWHEGSYGTPENSLIKHYDWHNQYQWNGKLTLQEYVEGAESLAEQVIEEGIKGDPVEGRTLGVLRYRKDNLYVDLAPDGRIISYGKNKW